MKATSVGIIAVAVVLALAASAGAGESAGKGKVCGGIAGIRCDSPKEFCEYRIGTCQVPDGQGVCTTIPEMCTQQFDPVCGCDGNTYGNDCQAASKSQSIAHKGECKKK